MATTKKSTKEMIVICKYTLKRNGAVIYRMRSNQPNKLGRIEGRDQVERNGEWYDAYMVSSDGETVCGCQTSGEQCPGSKYRGKCCHREHAQMLLDARKAAKVAQQEVKSSSQEVVSLDDKRRERDMLDAPLTRNTGFQLLKVS